MYKDLQDFVNVLEQKGQLKRIKAQVDSELEITEIVDRVVKSGGPALLFENVKGSEFPLLINTFGTYERMKLALEVESLDDIAREIEELIDVSNYVGLFNKIRSATRLAKLAKIFPKKVKQGACQEVMEEPNLYRLPILKCWPGDGGRFITLPLVITRDPETGVQNMGMYRLQVFDEKTTGMHWHLHKDGREIYEKYKRRGQKMPVAVALGCDPATIYASTAPLPKEIDEMVFAGFLRKAPLELVKCKTCDIYVPANAEFVLEGYVDIDELREEGPFGDHTGYYSLKDYYPVFHITCMTRKKNPIYPATVVGKPPMEDCFLGKATERIFLPFLKILCPEIVDINFPLEGVFHNCVIVSIKKRFPGHAKKVMHALWGIGQMMYTKIIVVVDENVDPKDLSTVAWKVFNNVDPKRDVVIVDGPLDALDHASPMKHYGSKMGIDATKKWKEEGHEREWPDEITMDPKIKELVDRRWKEYGF
ncbi:3-octaprenyl-4-hydroxybenzoate carboxy-lyase [Fervidicola ferrireducens]|uniref:3-octaprenyl-4-hydroxybenzoate carboxy-lyase n=1 Tax=Fervidicola ferrireducens TaxID=520764 RepID=A0A140LBY3_9FIRM|nr:menaquinone biosynthesis decarboxylase [Fervidicola ferrireducens]KXG78058.1 3-octaprenyl-4-hydroxybenzoate carboxy-lyase [Fervidicola ferrireducens]